MPNAVLDFQNKRALVCGVDGPILRDERDVGDFLALAWDHDAAMLAVPVARIDPSFFQLRNGRLGAIVQKFVNYRVQLAVLGDVSQWVRQSAAFRDYVHEANKGGAVWFVADEAELKARLS